MIDRDLPVTEDELHAYIDGELPADRSDVVAAWLADHPEQAALVASWRAQAESVRARYGAVAEEPVPERLKLDQVLKYDRANGRSWAAMVAAAAVVAFVAGGTAGWMARGASAAARTDFDVFASEALDAYKLYVVEVRHPVEVPGNERAHMNSMVVEAAWRGPAHSRSAIDRPKVDRRPASSRSDRSGGFLHVRKPVRRALYDLLREGRQAADGVTLHQRGAIRRVLLGR